MNWYKKSKKESIKQPYKVVVIKHGIEITPTDFKNIRKEAYSSEQARMMFLKDYVSLSEYFQIGWDVEARLDKEEIKRRQDIKDQEDKQIQDAWWNQ